MIPDDGTPRRERRKRERRIKKYLLKKQLKETIKK